MLVLAVAMLLFASGALAYAPIEHEAGRASQHDIGHLSRMNTSEVPTPAELHRAVATDWSAVARWSPSGAEELRTASHDVDPDDDCCGVSCHAAVGNWINDGRGRGLFAASAPIELPGLDGKSQDPPERPPRRA